MIQRIRAAFNELLEEVPWMDEETRIVAREKVIDHLIFIYNVLLYTVSKKVTLCYFCIFSQNINRFD